MVHFKAKVMNTNKKLHAWSQTHWLVATRSGQNSNKAIAGKTSETFTGWLNHQDARWTAIRREHIIMPQDNLLYWKNEISKQL